jgi:hypothetical protein
MNDYISNAIFNLNDVKKALSRHTKERPVSNDGTGTTIGMCLDDAILFLEDLERLENE